MKMMKKSEFEKMYPEHAYTLKKAIESEMLGVVKIQHTVLVDEEEALALCERMNKGQQGHDLVYMRELSLVTGVAYNTIRMLAARGVIKPANKYGRALYSVHDVEEKLRKMKQKGGAKNGRDTERK